MEKTTYQQPELRNAQDQVVQSGAYGKNTALCNTQNTGAFDYINNNLQYLYDTQGTTTTDLTQAKADITQAKADIVSLQSGKANKATTLAGYGITDAYTKSTVDAQGDRITANEGDIDTLQAQMAGTSDSALKEQILQKVDKDLSNLPKVSKEDIVSFCAINSGTIDITSSVSTTSKQERTYNFPFILYVVASNTEVNGYSTHIEYGGLNYTVTGYSFNDGMLLLTIPANTPFKVYNDIGTPNRQNFVGVCALKASA